MRRELKRRQDRLKAANDVHRDGLCGVEDVLNGREVEIGGFVRRDAAKKQRVREIGALQMRRAVLRSELQPENRRENERQGREVDAASSAVKKRENRADETHIVVLGKPTRDDGGAVRVESAKDDVDVSDERGDGDHDAFGKRCAARSVLEEAEMIAGEVESRLVCVIRRENKRETGRDVGKRRRFQNGTEVDPFQVRPLDARRSEEGFHVSDALDLHVLAAMKRKTKENLSHSATLA